MRWRPWILSCLLIAASRWAAAQGNEPPSELYALAWVRGDGAEDCPAAPDLQQEIEWRVGRRVFDPAASHSIEASVRRDGTTAVRRSEIHVRDAGGKTLGRRSLESREGDCRSLFSSTALAIALVVDPGASTAPRPSAVAPIGDAVPVPSSNLGAPPIPASGAALRSTSSPGSAGSATPTASYGTPPNRLTTADGNLRASNANPNAGVVATTSPPRVVGADSSSSAMAGVPRTTQTADATNNKPITQVLAAALIAAGILPGAEPGASLTWRALPTHVVGWSLSAHYLHHAASDAVLGSSVEVGLTSLEATLDLELLANDHVRWFADLGPAVGALQIAVRGSTATGPTERLFLAGRAGVAMQLRLQGSLFVELGLTAVLPWLQTRLVRSDARLTEIWREPSIGGMGRIGMGVAFP